MNVCCCSLAGTEACLKCPNNIKYDNNLQDKLRNYGTIHDWSDVAAIMKLVERMEDVPRKTLIGELLNKYGCMIDFK